MKNQQNNNVGQEKQRYSDVVVLGGASLDRMFYQRKDGSWPANPDKSVPGGKGANQAVAASRAGVSVSLISRLGDDFIGAGIISNLEESGVDVSRVEMVSGLQNDSADIKIAVEDKDNDIVRVAGAIESFTPDMVTENVDAILSAKVVVSQLKAPKPVIEKLIDFCYKNHKFLVLTPCRPKKLVATEAHNIELINKIGMIFCNQQECETIFGTKDIESCVSQYPCKLVVTLGDKGLVYHDGDSVIKMPAIRTQVQDTTGAGDTLCGNFVAAYCKGMSVIDALKRAICAATIKIQKESAQAGMPYEEELEMFIENLKLAAEVKSIMEMNSLETIGFFS